MSIYKELYLYKELRSLLAPTRVKMKYWFLQYKYREHSDPRFLDWDWTQIRFNRIALANLLVSRIHDCNYLEIGCASNSLFDSIPTPKKTGVDPEMGGNVRKTSDDFFRDNVNLFDVIFIDGLHTYSQVRKDVINSINCLKPNGYIALHDMLPRSWKEHHVPIVSPDDWTGDVWKVGFELSQAAGIDFKIIKIDHGVGVVRLTEEKPSLVDLTEELADKEFSYFYENVSRLPIVEWTDCQAWLMKDST